MFIDTASANKRSFKPEIKATNSSSCDKSSTPLLENFVGQANPPPSYAEATTPGLYSARLSNEEGDRLLSLDGREVSNAKEKEKQYRRKRCMDMCMKRKWSRILALVLALLIPALVVLALSLTATKNDHTAKIQLSSAMSSAKADGLKLANPSLPLATDTPKLSQQSPVAQPQPQSSQYSSLSEPSKTHEPPNNDDKDTPHLIAVLWPTPTADLNPTSTSSKQSFPIRWPASCGKNFNVKTMEHDFGTTNELTIIEAIHRVDDRYKRVSGWIHIVKAPADQAPGTIQVKISMAASPSVNMNSIQYQKSENGIVIGDPSYADGFNGVGRGSSCLGMSIIMYMAPGVSLDTLDVVSTHMGMQIHSDVDFTVTNSTYISLTTGTLDAAALPSRQTLLQTISGSISGAYALNDLLSIVTKSGSVNINVQPLAATSSPPKPAVFKIDTTSGRIRVDFRRRNIPNRDYQTFVSTTIGEVDGSFIHGSYTQMTSEAGMVIADILPFTSGAVQSQLYTNSHLGQTKLVLRTPYLAAGVPLTGLISTHHSTSGAMNITYPEEWVGNINGTSMSGALHLAGGELELIKENDQPGKNHVEAKKGNGGSMMTFDTISGGCEIIIGRENAAKA